MKRKHLKEGREYVVVGNGEVGHCFPKGSIVKLYRDDHSNAPDFEFIRHPQGKTPASQTQYVGLEDLIPLDKAKKLADLIAEPQVMAEVVAPIPAGYVRESIAGLLGKVDQKFVVITEQPGTKTGHAFKVGDVVTLTKLNPTDGYFKRDKDGWCQYLHSDDVIPLAPARELLATAKPTLRDSEKFAMLDKGAARVYRRGYHKVGQEYVFVLGSNYGEVADGPMNTIQTFVKGGGLATVKLKSIYDDKCRGFVQFPDDSCQTVYLSQLFSKEDFEKLKATIIHKFGLVAPQPEADSVTDVTGLKHDLHAFMPGDKVCIVKDFSKADYHKLKATGFTNSFTEAMAAEVGKDTIHTVKDTKAYGVYVKGDCHGWPSFALKLVERNVRTGEHNKDAFKPGDKVRVVGTARDYEGWDCGWNEKEMTPLVGQVFTVSGSTDNGFQFKEPQGERPGYTVSGPSWDSYTWPSFVLELVEAAPVAPPKEPKAKKPKKDRGFKVGDKVTVYRKTQGDSGRWVRAMDNAVGKTGRIVRLEEASEYWNPGWVKVFIEDVGAWWYPRSALKRSK